jgi:hypothetical protein
MENSGVLVWPLFGAIAPLQRRYGTTIALAMCSSASLLLPLYRRYSAAIARYFIEIETTA